jgi:DNA-binding GntR family transcriptional regulator
MGPGQPVPSESRLASRYGVSRTTARRALVVLEGAGLIEGGAGRVRTVRGAGRTPTARYEQIAATLRAEIEGRAAGEPLGTETALATRFDVSPGTARRALQELADSGTITAVPGQGWFVGPVDASRTGATASAIRTALLAGEWSVGATLPGELALASRFGVGRVTVRRALAVLEAEGLLDKPSARGRAVLMLPSRA